MVRVNRLKLRRRLELLQPLRPHCQKRLRRSVFIRILLDIHITETVRHWDLGIIRRGTLLQTLGVVPVLDLPCAGPVVAFEVVVCDGGFCVFGEGGDDVWDGGVFGERAEVEEGTRSVVFRR